jgi:hypothetical protein
VLVYYVTGLILMGVLHKKVLRLPTDRGRWVESAAFWAGFLLLAGVYHTVYHFPAFTFYRLFLYPVLLLVILWTGVMSSYLVHVSDRIVGKLLSVAGAVAWTAFIALVPYFFSLHYNFWGYLSFAALLLLTAGGALLVETKKLPIY